MGGYTYNDEYEEVVISSMGSASTALESLKSIASGISIPSDFTYKSALEKIIADISSFDLNETINTMASSMLSFMQSEMTASELANKDGYVTYYELVAQMHQKPKQKSEYTKKEKPKKTKYEEMWDRLNKSTESAREKTSEEMRKYNEYRKIYDNYTNTKAQNAVKKTFLAPVSLFKRSVLSAKYAIEDMIFDETKDNEIAENFTKAFKAERSKWKEMDKQNKEAEERYLKELEEYNNKYGTNYGKNLGWGYFSEVFGQYGTIGLATLLYEPLGYVLHGASRGMEAAEGYLNMEEHSNETAQDYKESAIYGLKVGAITTASDFSMGAMGKWMGKQLGGKVSRPVYATARGLAADGLYLLGVLAITTGASISDGRNYFSELSKEENINLLSRDIKALFILNFAVGMADSEFNRGVIDDVLTAEKAPGFTAYDVGDKSMSEFFESPLTLASILIDKIIYDHTWAPEAS